MFAKIPQRLTAPFGLLGDEAKLAFRSQPGGITKLAMSRVCATTVFRLVLIQLSRIFLKVIHTGIK
jgi:hypothetical protein